MPYLSFKALARGSDLPAVRVVERHSRAAGSGCNSNLAHTTHTFVAQHSEIMCACHRQSSAKNLAYSNLLLLCGMSTSMATQRSVPPMAQVSEAVCKLGPNCAPHPFC